MNTYFGTDGIRGVYGKEITPRLCYFAGLALCIYRKSPTVLLARDLRPSGSALSAAFLRGVRAGGGTCLDLGVMPTPGLSFCMPQSGADFGVVVSASHNPKEYNGLKFFSADGTKFSAEEEKGLEKILSVFFNSLPGGSRKGDGAARLTGKNCTNFAGRSPKFETSLTNSDVQAGDASANIDVYSVDLRASGAGFTVQPKNDGTRSAAIRKQKGAPHKNIRPQVSANDYLVMLCKGATVRKENAYGKGTGSPLGEKNLPGRGDDPSYRKERPPGGEDGDLSGLKIALDLAGGSANGFAESAFLSRGARVSVTGGAPGTAINDGCGATHPERISAFTRLMGADLGFAFDGDGDRVVCCDGDGKIFDGDDLLVFLSRALAAKKAVGTVLTNGGAARALQGLGAEFFRAGVGDRNVADLMRKTGATVGTETAGHILLFPEMITGDGILAALFIAACYRESGAAFFACPGYKKYPSASADLQTAGEITKEELQKISAAIVGDKRDDTCRLVLRKSGTEPVIRVYAESENVETPKKIVARATEILQNRGVVK